MSEFKVGEVALAHNWKYMPEANGREVVVVGPLEMRLGTRMSNKEQFVDLMYLISYENENYVVAPQDLRKKPPKSKHTGIPTAVLALFDPNVAAVNIDRMRA